MARLFIFVVDVGGVVVDDVVRVIVGDLIGDWVDVDIGTR
jgi:hypothetical protein